jgi:hypothetical protein
MALVSTDDLLIMDNATEHILRITSNGRIDILLKKSELQTFLINEESYGPGLSFNNRGFVIDPADGGSLYFTITDDDTKSSIVKFDLTTGELSLVIANSTIIAATGEASSSLRNLDIGPDGRIYTADSTSNDVLKCHPVTGAVTVLTTKEAIEALGGITTISLVSGPIVNSAGKLYVASDDTPSALFEIDITTGTPTVVVSTTLSDPDVYMDFHPFNGDIVISDDAGGNVIYRITPGGSISTFISEAELEAVTGDDVDLEGGIKFHNSSLFIAEENSDTVLQFDMDSTGKIISGSGSTYVEREPVARRLGRNPDYDGDIVFINSIAPKNGLISPEDQIGAVNRLNPYTNTEAEGIRSTVDYYVQDRNLRARKLKEDETSDIDDFDFFYFDNKENGIDLDILTDPN